MAEPTRKLFDVAHPGQTPPHATSRPVIVSHRPILKDPMVQERSQSESDSPLASHSARERVLTAPAGLSLPSSENHQPTSQTLHQNDAKQSVAPNPPSSVGQEDSAATPNQPMPSETDNSEAVIGSVVEQAADKKKQAEVDKKIAEQQAKVDELIASKKYFVPINLARRRRGNRTIVVGLVGLTLLAVAGLLAVQLGLLKF